MTSLKRPTVHLVFDKDHNYISDVFELVAEGTVPDEKHGEWVCGSMDASSHYRLSGHGGYSINEHDWVKVNDYDDDPTYVVYNASYNVMYGIGKSLDDQLTNEFIEEVVSDPNLLVGCYKRVDCNNDQCSFCYEVKHIPKW